MELVSICSRGKFTHWSERRDHPFVLINCTTLNENLLETELFGHVRGAFTGAVRDKRGRIEAAAEGTIFLDEVAELSSRLQVKLLWFLEEQTSERVGGEENIKVDVRVIAATNRDLDAEVRSGSLRWDLYYRLNVISLRIPALRETRATSQCLRSDFSIPHQSVTRGRA